MLKYGMALQDAALSWLDSSMTARLIVDTGFRILWANKAARQALDSRELVEERDGIFTMTNSTSTAVLEAEAVKLRDDSLFVQSFTTDEEVGLVMVIRLLPCRSPEERLYGLELRRPRDAESVLFGGYRSYFGVTQAEDRVLQQLLKGHNVEKCAAILDISVDTVRSHIRQLYSKMNVSSREALFHVMMPFRIQ